MTDTPHTIEIKSRIRQAASTLFAEYGFTGTGVREIAAAAQVNPAIVIRHFKSKERLFLETVRLPDSWHDAITGPLESVGYRLAHAAIATVQSTSNGYVALVQASDHAEIAGLLHELMNEVLIAPLIDRLTTEFDGAEQRIELRAHLFAAQLQGLLDSLLIRRDSTLLATDPEELAKSYGALMQLSLTGFE